MNIQWQRIAIIVMGLIVFFVILVMNILQIGGREVLSTANNLVLLGYGVFSTGVALFYWRSIHNREEANRIWLVLGLGLGFDIVGQLTWMAYNQIGVEVPYPSLADLFWMFYYFFVFIALSNKNLLLGIMPQKGQIAAGVAFGTIFFLMIGNFILVPTLEYAESAPLVETLLNFLYPIWDFLLLVAVSFLVIILWKGKLSLPWIILAAGFFLLATADVLFIYADLNELYYAEGYDINLITRSVDVVYALSSFLIALGVYTHGWVATVQPETLEFEFTHKILVEQSKARPKPFTHEMQILLDKVFFMVDGNQNVYFFSHYYRELWLLLDGAVHFVGSPLYSVLGIDKHIAENIFSDAQLGKTSIVPVEIVIGITPIPAVLRVSPARNGCDVFLQYRHEGKPIAVQDKKSIETFLVEETLRSVQGLEYSSVDMRMATAFFIIEVQEMYLFLVRMGGYRIGQVLVDKFNKLAADQNARVTIIDGQVVLENTLDTNNMYTLLQLTLKTVQDLTSTEATRKVIMHLNERLPEGFVRSAQNVGLAL